MKSILRSSILILFILFASSAFGEESSSPEPFTVAWMTDTQCLVYYDDLRDRFYAQTNWIASEYEKENIILVLHTGDIMNNSFASWELEHAERAFSVIDPSLPLLVVAGNHDIGVKKQSYENWPSFHFVQRVPFAQRFMDGRGVYSLIERSNQKLLFVGLGYNNLTEEAVQWAVDQFNANPDAIGIFFTHSFIDSRGDLLPDGRYFDKYLLPKCDNLRLVLCGHSRGTAHKVRHYTREDGTERTVDILMSNFQGNSDGAGALRLIKFDPIAGTLSLEGNLPFENPSRKDYLRLERATITIENFFHDNC